MPIEGDEYGRTALLTCWWNNTNWSAVIYSFALLVDFDRWLRTRASSNFPVHIELETGMNRLGFAQNEAGPPDTRPKQSNFKIQKHLQLTWPQ